MSTADGQVQQSEKFTSWHQVMLHFRVSNMRGAIIPGILASLGLIFQIRAATFEDSLLGYQVDQRNEFPIGPSTQYINSLVVLGQEFVPSLDQMNFMQLSVNADPFVGPPVDGLIVIRIREGSLDGPVLGTSESVGISRNYKGIADFYFANSIHLNPGDIYLFQPVSIGGYVFLTTAVPEVSDYPKGRAFIDILNDPVSDLWFREGVAVPEPSVMSLGVVGILLIGYYSKLLMDNPLD